jgi:cob(I)alamin adenosyltransferase
VKRGYVQVYTGEGKGKTTAALGLCLRAAGAGHRVYVAQFLKKGAYSELAALAAFPDRITLEQFGTGRFVGGRPGPEDVEAARRGLEAAKEALASGRFDVVVLDEACVASAKGLISIDELLGVVTRRPQGVEVVITGRGADQRLIDTADLVTEMRAVKHYFDKGVAAREGIER